MDNWTKEKRSEVMSRIRGKDTKPELVVRSLLHRMGYRFRLHRRDLPGNPDIVLARFNTIVFVHGCFWHRHRKSKCKYAGLPKSRLDYWLPKLEGNRRRDKKKQAELRKMGWRVFVVWQCELRDLAMLGSKLRDFFDREDH